MSTLFMDLIIVWLILLAISLSIIAMRDPTNFGKIVALDSLALLIVGVLSMVALQFQRAVLLDVALSVGLIGYVQTLATARALDPGREGK